MSIVSPPAASGSAPSPATAPPETVSTENQPPLLSLVTVSLVAWVGAFAALSAAHSAMALGLAIAGAAAMLLAIRQVLELRRQTRETTRALAGAQAKLEEVQRIGHLGFWSYDAMTHDVYWSEHLYELYRLDPKLGAPNFDDVLAAYDNSSAERLGRAVAEALAHGTPYSLTLKLRDQSRDIRYVLGQGQVTRDSAGEVTGLFGTCMDVTHAVEYEHSVAQITAGIPGVVYKFQIDANGERSFPFVSDSCLDVCGVSGRDAMADPKHLFDAVVEEDRPSLEQSIEDSQRTMTRWKHQYRFQMADGQIKTLLAQSNPIRLANGATVWHGYFNDVSEAVEFQAELQRARREAEQANLAKSEFLANMSHEIRTPMTAILGYVDLIGAEGRDGLDDHQRTQAIETVRSNASHLMTIINDILDMSKIEAGRLTVECLRVDPIQLVREVLSLTAPRAAAKSLELRATADSRIPCSIWTDPTRLRQILLNIVGNAVKFTQEGSVQVVLSFDAETASMHFRVVDTGIGMSTEQVDHIGRFDAFSQADTSMSRRFGGTGLGLKISNSLARMLGGYIDVHSMLHRGSEFTVSVRAGALDDVTWLEPGDWLFEAPRGPGMSTAQRELQGRLAGARVLVAEDGPDNQRLISYLLRKAGAEVHLAENGRVAIDLVDGARGDERFDLVLMDMAMPELDGYEAARILRDRGCMLPIVALTAHAMAEDRRKCLAAGCSDYLTKPIDRTDLIAACEKWVTPNEGPKPPD